MARRFTRGKKGRFICDRSGMEYPISEAVIEPGTGYMVHKSESDGMWNLVDHPQNFSFHDFSDPKTFKDVRVDRNEEEANFVDVLLDETGDPITDEDGFLIITEE